MVNSTCTGCSLMRGGGKGLKVTTVVRGAWVSEVRRGGGHEREGLRGEGRAKETGWCGQGTSETPKIRGPKIMG